MNKNLYGGISYPASSFVFDWVYNNYAEAINNIETDGILIGRYILVAYCDTALSQDVKNIIEFSDGPFIEDITDEKGNVLVSKDEANEYYNNFITDGKKSCDRKVYRKIYYKPEGEENYKYAYQEIASLNTTIGQDTIEALNEKIDIKINTIIGGAPETLDTLKEIADWIAKDETGTIDIINKITLLQQKTQWQTF